ncbi:hypothetical protein BKD02_18010 [Brucella sp. 09RB8910]|nr:hypothetical protein BKD02_18010 [Brucella sp. 09RB8910]
MPLLQPMGKVGRPREHDPRMLWSAIQYIAVTGCQWRNYRRNSSYHVVTDMMRNMLEGIMHSADVQDRYGVPNLIKSFVVLPKRWIIE